MREWIVDGGASVLIGTQAIGTGFDVKHVEAVLDWGARYDMQQLVRGPGRAARAAREVESRGYGITHWSGPKTTANGGHRPRKEMRGGEWG